MSRSAKRAAAWAKAARLRAVQALYQMDIGGTPVETVIDEFAEELGTQAEAQELFASILRGAVAEQASIDAALTARLAKGWRLTRLDSTLRAILRCGAYELLHSAQVPTPVLLAHYTDIAHAFFDGAAGGMCNAVLAGVAENRGAR